jgi:hypothetical protein
MNDEWLKRISIEDRIERAGSSTLCRLQLLVQKGYMPDFTSEAIGTISLYHPCESYKHKILYLYGCGAVVSAGPPSGQFRIGRDDSAAFNTFLNGIPVASIWDRTVRMNIYAWVLLGGALYIGAIMGWTIEHFINAFSR